MSTSSMINRIVCGDCLRLMAGVPDNSINLTVTSPPYNCRMPYDSYSDDLDWDVYVEWCRSWLTELYRVSADDGRVCINVLMEMGIEGNKTRVSPFATVYRLLQDVGFKHAGVISWQDRHRSRLTAWGSWMSASSPYIYNPSEVILIAYKNVWKRHESKYSTITHNEFIKATTGVWDIRPDTRPLTVACFPIEIPTRLINLLTYEGDLVLDPFVGSCTTAVAAYQCKRRYIGFDLSPAYVKIAQDRVVRARDLLLT